MTELIDAIALPLMLMLTLGLIFCLYSMIKLSLEYVIDHHSWSMLCATIIFGLLGIWITCEVWWLVWPRLVS